MGFPWKCDESKAKQSQGAALVDDAMSVASDDSDLSVVSAASSAESKSGPQQYLFQSRAALQWPGFWSVSVSFVV